MSKTGEPSAWLQPLFVEHPLARDNGADPPFCAHENPAEPPVESGQECSLSLTNGQPRPFRDEQTLAVRTLERTHSGVSGLNESRQSEQAEMGRPPVLLVVEDESDDYVLLRRALQKCGASAQVFWAQSADEALDALAKLEPRVSRICVVVDVKLPGADGFELLQTVKSRAGQVEVRFAFLTGRHDAATERRAYAAGADAFFLKPIQSEGWIEVARGLDRLVQGVRQTSGS